MGFLGASYGQQSGTSSSSGTQSTTFGPFQQALQSSIGSVLGTLIPSLSSGTNPANVNAAETASADQINKTSGGTLDRVTQFLSSRGFGKSGQTGKAGLTAELGRESALAANQGNFASTALNYGSTLLSQALAYAFNGTGQTTQQQGKTDQSGFGVSGAVGFGGK